MQDGLQCVNFLLLQSNKMRQEVCVKRPKHESEFTMLPTPRSSKKVTASENLIKLCLKILLYANFDDPKICFSLKIFIIKFL